jgi:hypothetical protein
LEFRTMRPRAVLAFCIAAVVGVALLAIPTTRGALSALGSRGRAAAAANGWLSSPSPDTRLAHFATQAAPPAPTLRAPADPASIKAPGNPGFFGWALLDRKTGAITGSANSATGTNTTESMVKAWITSDYLRMQAAAGKTPSDAVLNELTLMIVDSNDDMAEKYYRLGGSDALLKRMISMCGLTHTTLKPYTWAMTLMPPQDAVRYGQCVANGTAAGPKWTGWVLDTMKRVRGGVNDQISLQRQGGRWGIIDGLPPELVPDVSIKNGWTNGYPDGWHVNCLAIERDWVLNVMVRIGSLQGGANVCKAVAQQLVYTPDI